MYPKRILRFFVTEMLRPEGFENTHLREDRAATHAGDQIGDRPAATLRMEQIHDRERTRLAHGRRNAERGIG